MTADTQKEKLSPAPEFKFIITNTGHSEKFFWIKPTDANKRPGLRPIYDELINISDADKKEIFGDETSPAGQSLADLISQIEKYRDVNNPEKSRADHISLSPHFLNAVFKDSSIERQSLRETLADAMEQEVKNMAGIVLGYTAMFLDEPEEVSLKGIMNIMTRGVTDELLDVTRFDVLLGQFITFLNLKETFTLDHNKDTFKLFTNFFVYLNQEVGKFNLDSEEFIKREGMSKFVSLLKLFRGIFASFTS